MYIRTINLRLSDNSCRNLTLLLLELEDNTEIGITWWLVVAEVIPQKANEESAKEIKYAKAFTFRRSAPRIT